MARREQRTCDERAGRPTGALTLERPSKATLAAAAALVGGTWYPDEPVARRGACERIELEHHLEHATYVRAAMLEERFAGIVAAGPAAHRDTTPSDASALWYRKHLRAVAPWTMGTPDEEAIAIALAPITAEMATTQEFIETGDPRSAWEITLLIVDPACHGRGIGRVLLSSALCYLREQGAPGFFLATDDGCDFGFYDHLGLERIATREAWGFPSATQGHPAREPRGGASVQSPSARAPFRVYLYGAWLGDEGNVR